MTDTSQARAAGGACGTAWRLVWDDRARFEEALRAALDPQEGYLTEVELATYRGGKKLRPLLLVLAARLAAAMETATQLLPQKAIEAAVALEMLHVATLIHDDIIDVAPLRRGEASVHAARGTEIAVLIGDLQFVQAIRVFAGSIDSPEDMRLVRLVLDVGFDICRGEIDELQTHGAPTPRLLRHRYFRTIDRKTAVLFGLACEAGASLAGAGRRATYLVSRYGRSLGRAFQVMDDLTDFLHPGSVAGKEPYADLRQRRYTLPIIYALDEFGPGHAVARILRGEPFTSTELAAAGDAVVASRGFDLAYNQARRLVIEAVSHLEAFPTSPVKDALVDVAYEVVDRGAA